jgi:Skp family chaperone for outer membrane proteins
LLNFLCTLRYFADFCFISVRCYSTALVEQIRSIKKTSEARLEMMKKEVVAVEAELEEVRYTASLAGVTTNKEYKKQLGEKQQKMRQIKEKTEAMEQLQQRVVAGLAHISDILFIPKSEDDAPVSDLHKNIEAVLDTLINEREKQLQQQQQGQAQGQMGMDSQSKMANTRDSGSVVSNCTNKCVFVALLIIIAVDL